MGSGSRIVHDAGFNADFGDDFEINDTMISPSTRLRLSFIDFTDGKWSEPPPVEPTKLKSLILKARRVAAEEQYFQSERFRKIGDRYRGI